MWMNCSNHESTKLFIKCATYNVWEFWSPYFPLVWHQNICASIQGLNSLLYTSRNIKHHQFAIQHFPRTSLQFNFCSCSRFSGGNNLYTLLILPRQYMMTSSFVYSQVSVWNDTNLHLYIVIVFSVDDLIWKIMRRHLILTATSQPPFICSWFLTDCMSKYIGTTKQHMETVKCETKPSILRLFFPPLCPW